MTSACSSGSSSPDNWTGDGGILTSLWDTVTLSAAVVLVAILIAVPLALILAHKRQRRADRHLGGHAQPGRPDVRHRRAPGPDLAAERLGIRAVADLHRPAAAGSAADLPQHLHRGARGATRAPSTPPGPWASPSAACSSGSSWPWRPRVIFAGIRVAAVQVVATEPIRAFLGGDGIGRYVRDGLGQNNDTLLLGGAILVAALAALTGLAFGLARARRSSPGRPPPPLATIADPPIAQERETHHEPKDPATPDLPSWPVRPRRRRLRRR